MAQLLGIVGSVSKPSKTLEAVRTAVTAAEDEFGIESEVVHLAGLDLATADGRRLEAYEGDTAHVLDRIIAADAYVIGTPVYRASYSGALKNLFDMIPRGMWQADVAPLAGRAVGLVATGATAHHYLALDQELRPVMAFFGAVVSGGVYAHSDQFREYEVADEDVRTRLQHLGKATVELQRALESSTYLSSLGPQF